jgi:hypothetical protein
VIDAVARRSAGGAGPGLMAVVVGTVSARLGVTVPGTAVVDQPAGPEASNRPPVRRLISGQPRSAASVGSPAFFGPGFY